MHQVNQSFAQVSKLLTGFKFELQPVSPEFVCTQGFTLAWKAVSAYRLAQAMMVCTYQVSVQLDMHMAFEQAGITAVHV